ncbi:MAG: FliI/YscN family ATPase [Actinomycetota bacterium]
MADLTLARDGYRATGAVARVAGNEVELRGLRLAVGEAVTVHARGGDRPAEVVALAPEGVRALVLGQTEGLARGDRVSPRTGGSEAVVGPALLGRVVDALGRPLDGGPPVVGERVALHAEPPPALARQRIASALPTGVRAIDTLATVGRGQRMGVFAGSGVGKSTLLGMMVRGTTADATVVCLVGERGREVREFVEDELGAAGLSRAVVVVSTSDEPPLLRLRAGMLATRIAERLADDGSDVLLTFDSLTRLATAQREVGLAAGEPPTARGYTPSVFSLLPRLLERAGPRAAGSITAFYTVLVDGDDMNEPIADAARSILDGHLVLDRSLAAAGRYPAIDPLESLSRLAATVTSPEQAEVAGAARAALSAAEEVRDLVEVGAYSPGSNPAADAGLALKPGLVDFLTQGTEDLTGYDEAWQRLAATVRGGS